MKTKLAKGILLILSLLCILAFRSHRSMQCSKARTAANCRW